MQHVKGIYLLILLLRGVGAGGAMNVGVSVDVDVGVSLVISVVGLVMVFLVVDDGDMNAIIVCICDFVAFVVIVTRCRAVG